MEFSNYRDAVENHWDPKEIDLSEDKEEVLKLADEDFFGGIGFDILRSGLAMFGAGEAEVTEDLAPLAVVLDDRDSQMFLTTQMYEEAKHAEFFERYWEEVINNAERQLGLEQSDPQDRTFFAPEYDKLFDKNEEAMNKLLREDSPENRVRAYSHYHLVIEGVLAQTGYWAFNETLSEENEETPTLPGLIEGFVKIRGDESRHVGFGIEKIKQHVLQEKVDIQNVNDVTMELLPLVQNIFMYIWDEVDDMEEYPAPSPEEAMNYVQNEHSSRMRQIERVADQ